MIYKCEDQAIAYSANMIKLKVPSSANKVTDVKED